MRVERVLVVYRKSLFQIYVKEHNERAVRHALRQRDAVALGLKQAHEAHAEALASVESALRRLHIQVVSRWRAHVRSTRSFDLVISLGGDGTLLDTSHRIFDDTPLLGINSDPERSVGALCAGTATDLPALLDALASRKLRPRSVTRIRVRVDGREVFGPTLDDVLFAHCCPAGLTRFDLAVVPAHQALSAHSGHDGSVFLRARGSGIWVSSAIGSTAAIHSAGGRIMPISARRLQYLVREPYTGPEPLPGARGYVSPGQALVLINRLRRGALWADGAHRRIALTYAQQVIIDHHPASLNLVLPRR